MGFTAIGVICAVAVGFPEQFVAVGLRVGIFLPSLAIATVFAGASGRKAWTFGSVMTGAVVGYFLSPARSAIYSSWVDRYWDDLVLAAPCAAGCAFVVGGAVWLIEFAKQRRLNES